jgi:hypothetical protein
MVETAAGSDMGIGLSLVFGVLAVVAAGVMAVTVETQTVAAFAFAAAMIAGVLAVAAPHLFGN